TTRSSPSSRARARPPRQPAASPNGWPSTTPASRPRSTTAVSRSTPTSSASSRRMPRRLRQLAELPVSVLDGVGPKKVEALATMEIETVLDLLTHYPRRYLDRTQQAAIKDLKVGDEAMVLAVVKRVQSRRTRQRRALVEVDVFDGTSYLRCTFFNQPWRAKQLREGADAVFFGKLEAYRGRRQITMVMRKRALEREAKGIRHTVDGELVRRFHDALPFPLTRAQRNAIDELAADLAGPHPMHRLLQGDVGAGKTVVAVTALLM